MNDENATPPGEPRKPASARKLASCRANGAKSNGPKTEEGKRRSAQNATKHGLTAVTVVVANEDKAEFDQLHAAYLDQFQPRTPVEIDLVAEIVCAKWRQRRLWSIESAQLDLELVRQREALDQQFEFITEDVRTALAYEEKAKPGNSFFALNRYESRLSRQYHRALRTLTELQANRPPALSPSQPAAELATGHQPPATQPTEQLPNEPNPDSGHRPRAQSPRFKMREAAPEATVSTHSSGAGVHAWSGPPDPQRASSQPAQAIGAESSAFLLHFTSGNERMSVPDTQL